MPDIADFILFFLIYPDSSSSHLISQNIRAYKTGKNKGINTGRIPAFTQKRFGADKNLDVSPFKKPGHNLNIDMLFSLYCCLCIAKSPSSAVCKGLQFWFQT